MFKDKRASFTVYEDGTMKIKWVKGSKYVQFSNVLALLITGNLDEAIQNTIYNKGLDNNLQGDAGRAQAIIQQIVEMKMQLMGLEPNEEMVIPGENDPAVPPEEAFSGEEE